MSDGEDAKAPKLNAAALCKCVFNIFDNSFDYPLYVGTVKMRITHSNQRDKLGFIQGFTLIVQTVPFREEHSACACLVYQATQLSLIRKRRDSQINAVVHIRLDWLALA